jgi:hypothetical protein
MPATKKMIALLRRGTPAVDPTENLIPLDFRIRVQSWKDLVKSMGGRDQVSQNDAEDMATFLSRFICANFVPENIEDIDEIIFHPQEVLSEKVNVLAFDFGGEELIPTVTVEAIFDLIFQEDLTHQALKNWEEIKGDPLAWCLNFFWCFEDLDDEDWEGYLDTNDGVEMNFLE